MARYGYALLWAICFCSITVQSQTRLTDSLRQNIYTATNDTQKLEAIIALCSEYKSINRDTLDLYVFKARQLALQVGNERLKHLTEVCVAYAYLRWGWKDSVLVTLQPVLQTNKVTNPQQRDIYFKASRTKAMAYAMHSYYQEALNILYQLVSEGDAYKDSLTVGENSNTIGSIALARSQPKDALVWLSRASMFCGNEPKFNAVKAAIHVNMSEAYLLLGKMDSSIYYINKGVELFRSIQNLSNLALALQRKSTIYTEARKFNEAEAALKELIVARRDAGDSSMFVDDNISLVNFYIQTNQVDKAIELCKTRLVRGDLYTNTGNAPRILANSIHIRLVYYEALAKCYKTKGETTLYQETLEQIVAAKDSFYQHNSAEAIAELETKYEVQKKENTIIQQQLSITRKNNRFYLLLGGALFIAVVSWLMFTSYRKREQLKMNMMLEKEKNLAAQSVVKAEENERKRIAADLHDNLGTYAASIVSNLDFITPEQKNTDSINAMQQLRNNSQAIVSQLNDTIWALKKDALTLTAISDRIKIFIQRIERSYPNIVITVAEKIETDSTLSPSHAFHLFRIMQEAINNALRHSKATEIILTIESNTNLWYVRVADNGTGINKTKPAGNGLQHMKERAAEAGWNIEWTANEPVGTIVVIAATTTN